MGEWNEYFVLQMFWVDWCCENLDVEIVCGICKEIMQCQYLLLEIYGVVMDKVCESIRVFFEGLWDVVRDVDFLEGQIEVLSDFLMFKGEIICYKVEGSVYEFFRGVLMLDWIGGDVSIDFWFFIEVIRFGVEWVYDVVYWFGLGFWENMGDWYEFGCDFFFSLFDWMYLVVVVVKCGVFMVKMEVVVKNMFWFDVFQFDVIICWLQEVLVEVECYEINFGLIVLVVWEEFLVEWEIDFIDCVSWEWD